MYRKRIATTGTIENNIEIEGESIEEKVRRITETNEPITDGAPTIYTERGDGVLGEYDPRTDKWDLAIDAMNVVSKEKLSDRQKRMNAENPPKKENAEGKNEGENGGEKA